MWSVCSTCPLVEPVISDFTGLPLVSRSPAASPPIARLMFDLPVAREQEFWRDKRWVDWKGVAYNLRYEWRYVNGPASQAVMTPGVRDRENAGKMPADFLRAANAHIQRRRSELSRNPRTR